MIARGLKVAAVAIGLTLLFWWPLASGGGLVGGDTYRYFLPQKVIYAELLRNHELPLWNDSVGFRLSDSGRKSDGRFLSVQLRALLAASGERGL
jgi:hypothetical protein